MRSLGDSPPRILDFEVLDGNDLPNSWVGRKVGVETVTAPRMGVGWLQSKSAWRLVVVDGRTGEPWCVPWVAVEAIFLLEAEPDAPGSPETVAEMLMGPEPSETPAEAPEVAQRPWWRRMFGG
jgi:hypothetical protein